MKTELILGIVHEVAKGWNDLRRSRFMHKYKDVIEELEKEEDAYFPNYNSARRALAEKRRDEFLAAFQAEIKAHNAEGSSD